MVWTTKEHPGNYKNPDNKFYKKLFFINQLLTGGYGSKGERAGRQQMGRPGGHTTCCITWHELHSVCSFKRLWEDNNEILPHIYFSWAKFHALFINKRPKILLSVFFVLILMFMWFLCFATVTFFGNQSMVEKLEIAMNHSEKHHCHSHFIYA